MKNLILRTPKPTKSNTFSGRPFIVPTFSDELFRTLTVAPSVGLFSKLTTKPTSRVDRLKTNEYLAVEFNHSILFARKSVVLFISSAYLVHNKKMNVHIIDSNSENDEEMSNTTAKMMNKCIMHRRTSQIIIAMIVLSV
jgi:hypothetical protein